MSDCIFCEIASGGFKTNFIATSENCVAFNDLSPQAPIHVLVISKTHIARISDISVNQSTLLGEIIYLAKQIADKKGLENYRLVMNCGEGAGQSVWHLHLHLLSGRKMQWPPG